MRGRPTADDPTQGQLGRLSTVVYWFVVIDLLLVLTTLPGLVALMVLARDSSNIPLVALALVPVGPALAAALFAWRDFERDPDQSPARHFWRGYRLNALDVLRVWVPVLAVLAVLGINAANLSVLNLPDGFGVVMAVLAGLIALWSAHLLVITSLFRFRTRDAARLAAYYLVAKPLVTLGVLSLLVLTAGVVLLVSDWVLGLLASVLTFWLLRNAHPLVADIEHRFVTPP